MTNTYIDAITYSKAPTGLNLTGQIGNIGRITAASAGATSLTLTQALTSMALNQYDALYVTDGPNSEILQVGSGGAAIGATSIPLQAATQFVHAGGTAYVTDGTQGSLGQAIFEASRWIEDEICRQALWATTYTSEILTMPTMRASLDNQYGLHFRPRHFPISTLTSVIIQTNAFNTVTYDVTQAIIDSDQQTVDLSPLAVISSQASQIAQASPWMWGQFDRGTNAWVTITYTAGFAVGAMPMAVTRACTLLTSEMFSQLVNPVGADTISQGKRSVNFVMRGDTSGDSLLVKQAKQLLSPYVAQSF